MTAPLTERELRDLDRLERRLRLTDPDLDRLLGRRASVRRLARRPRFLALAVSVLALATAGFALCAAASLTAAAGPAGVAAAALVVGFRRLSRLAPG
ncbi:DUF3040 domain-containing protein [Kitasatospora sp. KL5]|uniref:DUF3040 domain-containing protein n=1 Tax=Kitasatospora sp. KL5 TaxID=3425125 RepID=UPI003D6FF5F7